MSSVQQKVLIIEDNQLNLDMAKDLLEFEGFETFEAEEGETGLQMARQILPNLILLDLNLPSKSGFEVCEELRADPQTHDTPILAFTALAMEEDKQKARDCGFSGIITKPIDVNKFAKTVQGYIKA